VKILSVNYSDAAGGAARAAYRLHQALLGSGVKSRMQVVQANLGDWTVSCPKSPLAKIGKHVRPQAASLVRSFTKSIVKYPLSPSFLPSRWPALINHSEADLIHLHWLNAEMMSVEDIARIKKPTVWTLHDMWAFCGAEHVSTDNRWREGYSLKNRPDHEGGFDINRWVWNRKRKAWKKPIQLVTPSRWLANCVKESALAADWPVISIPNPINTDIWKPIDRILARNLMGLPQDVKLIAFGAMGGGQVYHKGYDLLLSALDKLRGEQLGLEVIIFGMMAPEKKADLGFPIHYVGHLHDDLSLRMLYSASDTMVIPSRVDNFPNTGVEAMACGVPVVAFDTCGLPDIVSHQKTGWLAKAFDTEDLARGISWVLADEDRLSQLGKSSRIHAEANYSYPIVASQYIALYQRILEA
jgi:glycosyltransferase involved in cell wall biosynthesis